MRFKFVFASGIIAISVPVAAQELWQGAQVGMTPAQVLAIQPGAARPTKVEKLASGARCELQLVEYEVVGDNYKVCFYFLNDHLSQVTLNFDGEPDDTDYESVLEALKARYGAPLSEQRTSLGYEADWMLANGTNISLIYIDELLPLININYQRRLAAEASRL